MLGLGRRRRQEWSAAAGSGDEPGELPGFFFEAFAWSFGSDARSRDQLPRFSGLASEQRESLPVVAGSVAFPNQLPAALQRNALISGLVLKQHEIASSIGPDFVPQRDDSGHVLQHGPLVLTEIPAGEAAMIRWQGALHGRKHPAVAFCAVEPRQPQRREQTPNQCE